MIKLLQGEYEKVRAYYQETMPEDYFEFQLEHTAANRTFRELDRFIWESRHQKTRFQNHYAGPVLIDLTQWYRRGTNEYFEAFLYYLKDHSELECTLMVQELCDAWFLEELEAVFELEPVELEARQEKEPMRRIGFRYEKGADDCVRSEISEVYHQK